VRPPSRHAFFALACAFAAAAGCSAGAPGALQAGVVALSVQDADPPVATGPLRYAVAYSYGSGFAVTADEPIEIGTTVSVPLVLPRGRWEAGVRPIESVTLPSLSTLEIYRPRLLVYEDVDQSGSLLPAGVEGGSDRVLAIDTSSTGPSVAAVIDLDTALAQMTFEETEAYYAASGGRYTPFIRVQSAGGLMQLVDANKASPITLKLSDSPVAGEHLRCRRDAVYLYGDPLSLATQVKAYVDTGIDHISVCGTVIADCSTEAFASLPPPDLRDVDTAAHRRLAQCRSNGSFDVLVIHSAEMTCGQCMCNYVVSSEAYFAAVGVTPSWWPCGTAVPKCTSLLPLYDIDPNCVSAPQ
jgi:hypothetical protein